MDQRNGSRAFLDPIPASGVRNGSKKWIMRIVWRISLRLHPALHHEAPLMAGYGRRYSESAGT
jgi:hypothetical protein